LARGGARLAPGIFNEGWYKARVLFDRRARPACVAKKIGILGANARIMGYNNDGSLGIACHTPQDFHHVDPGFMVEIAGRLIAND
jgi:hypothetical protein